MKLGEVNRTELYRLPDYDSLRARVTELEADRNCTRIQAFINDRAAHYVIKAEFKK